jgi:hypothetical protein
VCQPCASLRTGCADLRRDLPSTFYLLPSVSSLPLLVVLLLLVFDMAVKPTAEDTGTLVAMAVVLVAAIGYSLWRARAIDVVGARDGDD